MTRKRYSFVFVVLVVVLSLSSTIFGADSREIDVVLRKAKSANGALNTGDKEVIEDYLTRSLQGMVNSLDFKKMTEIRNEIISKSINIKPSQYSLAFAESLNKAVKPVLENVFRMNDKSRMVQLKLNVLILLTEVGSIELVKTGMSMFDDENAAVKYWAVNSVANSKIASQLKSKVTGDTKLAKEVLLNFENMINDNTLPEILSLMVTFADELNTSQADELLVRIADIRIKSYAQWDVQFEFMDAELLNALVRSISENRTASENEIAEFARRFAQLYSYAIQRYINGFDILDASQKNQLSFVLADVEQKSITKLLGRSQNLIKQLVNNSSPRSVESLSDEHDSLLGTASKRGRLAYEVKYDYGKQGGKPVTAPKRLPMPKVNQEQ